MVVTANPHASKAARDILQQGGSAIDAAIAAQMVLGLVEPQSSGIGGGAFLLHWDAKQQALTYYDGRETAPAAVDENYFLTDNGEKMGFFDAVIGGYAVGVPGVLDMFGQAHAQYGKLAWQDLFTPAITLANEGFAISPRLHLLLQHTPMLNTDPTLREYFFDRNNKPLPVGHILKNPDYAKTLSIIASQGSRAFYRGDISANIVKAVTQDSRKPGQLSQSDFDNYQAKIRPALCAPYRHYQVCGAAPPSSGASTVLAILGVLNHYDIATLSPDSAEFIHLFAEASNLAFADRNRYIADPDFVDTAVEQLLSDSYLQQRAQLIQPDQALQSYPAGDVKNNPHLPAASPEKQSTTHLSIVDTQGNAISMTSSIENAFGARLMVNGFLLNNQLTDFSFTPFTSTTSTPEDKEQKAIANRIEAGKRPRSSMAPTMIFDANSRLVGITGSPGGSRIIDYTAKSIIHLVDWQQQPAEAVSAPHIIARNNGVLELEGTVNNEVAEQLQALGHTLKEKNQSSGLHIIWQSFDKDDTPTLQGAADPRREGMAIGE